ncbi:hypothetical protein [Mucilaginibacter psychrotolerans]|uniref:hypothetical protein n=1 Tax=Mucilaginibacter psychrotolerans TaxID=1524096 RepID=UPI0013053018|nr:hypothetical protein [Mucilaginibacter psychrotolerans]
MNGQVFGCVAFLHRYSINAKNVTIEDFCTFNDSISDILIGDKPHRIEDRF